MPVNQSHSHLFDKLSRQLAKLTAKPGAESVHKFRTTGRRVEAVLDELVQSPNRNSKKLLKLLARLRKKAGRVRDLDVQISALRNLQLPEGAAHKSQLMRTLAEERLRREERLAKGFDRETVRELRKRLKRAAGEIRIPDGEALAQALRLVAKLARDPGPLTEKMLHQYRIVGKRARYLAELAGNDPKAERLAEQLKHMQDVIGDWHDWLKLTERAEELFGGMQSSALVAALRNLTRAKFRQAVDALAEARAGLAAKKPVGIESVARRGTQESAPQAAKTTAAVA
jgi:CHAD domain-containing protein